MPKRRTSVLSASMATPCFLLSDGVSNDILLRIASFLLPSARDLLHLGLTSRRFAMEVSYATRPSSKVGGAAAAAVLLCVVEEAARCWVLAHSGPERDQDPALRRKNWLGLVYELEAVQRGATLHVSGAGTKIVNGFYRYTGDQSSSAAVAPWPSYTKVHGEGMIVWDGQRWGIGSTEEQWYYYAEKCTIDGERIPQFFGGEWPEGWRHLPPESKTAWHPDIFDAGATPMPSLRSVGDQLIHKISTGATDYRTRRAAMEQGAVLRLYGFGNSRNKMYAVNGYYRRLDDKAAGGTRFKKLHCADDCRIFSSVRAPLVSAPGSDHLCTVWAVGPYTNRMIHNWYYRESSLTDSHPPMTPLSEDPSDRPYTCGMWDGWRGSNPGWTEKLSADEVGSASRVDSEEEDSEDDAAFGDLLDSLS
eukprot:SAG25_NODE_262_length_10711_cov_10.264512_2_plen_418_part_00